MKRFKNILCVVDVTNTRSLALERAVRLAENNGAILTVVDVIEHATIGFGMPESGPISADLKAAMIDNAEQKLDSLVDPYKSQIEIQTKALEGIKFLEIIREVLLNGRDLVIKTPENADHLSVLFSSEDMHLLRKCPCPVWLTKPEIEKTIRCILAAIDIDDGQPPASVTPQEALNRQILEISGSLALSEFAELHIVHAWREIDEGIFRNTKIHSFKEKVITYDEQMYRRRRTIMDELVYEVSSSLGQNVTSFLKPKAHLVRGRAQIEIPAMAKRIRAQLIVMGTVARTGIPGFIMGNTAEDILTQIDCSVLTIKPPGFVSPVTLER